MRFLYDFHRLSLEEVRLWHCLAKQNSSEPSFLPWSIDSWPGLHNSWPLCLGFPPRCQQNKNVPQSRFYQNSSAAKRVDGSVGDLEMNDFQLPKPLTQCTLSLLFGALRFARFPLNPSPGTAFGISRPLPLSATTTTNYRRMFIPCFMPSQNSRVHIPIEIKQI